MFIRKSTRKYKGKVYTNYILVESIRTPKGPRQKTVCSLGDLSPRPRSEWLKLVRKVENALVGQGNLLEETDPEVEQIVEKIKTRKQDINSSVELAQVVGEEEEEEEEDDDDDDDVLISVNVDKVNTENYREAGPVHVGLQFWKRLGIDTILEDVGLDSRTRTLTCIMTMARLIHPCSEHAMPDWIRTTALPDILGLDLEKLSHDSLYRNMDRLHPNRGAIETHLAEKERNIFNLDQSIFFYDLTSTYFEGNALSNSKAKRGYSRDKRPDCKQVVIGLAINRDGFPVAHEIFEGNRQDRKSLGEMLDILDNRIGLKSGQTVVVDRGMSYDDNLEEIRERNLHYIVASRQTERDQWLGEFEDAEGFTEVIRMTSPQNPFQKKSKVQVKMKEHGEEMYVLCLSEGRKEKDRAIREKKEKKLHIDLDKLKKRVEKGLLKKPEKIGEAIGRIKERYPRVARYYKIEYISGQKEVVWNENKEKRTTAEKLDGSYILKTDRKEMSATEIWKTYSLLTRSEKAFRDMKSPLCERPIFHQLENRVETHIFLCLLAYHLLIAIEKTLLDKGVHTSWETVKKALSTHQVSTVVLPTNDDSVLRIRKGSVPEPMHKRLYNLLEVPHEIMKPIKSWFSK